MSNSGIYYLVMVLLAFASFMVVVGKLSLEATRATQQARPPQSKQDMPHGLTA